jgi:hypothetical protein
LYILCACFNACLEKALHVEGKDDLLKRIREQNNSVSKIKLEDLESEYKYVLERMINSKDNYNELYGYYFSAVVELYSR